MSVAVAAAAAASPVACPEHNFVTLSSNDTKFGVHVPCNEPKCGAQ